MFTSNHNISIPFFFLPAMAGTEGNSALYFQANLSAFRQSLSVPVPEPGTFRINNSMPGFFAVEGSWCSKMSNVSGLQIHFNMKVARKSQQEATFLPNRGIEPNASCPPMNSPTQNLSEDEALEFELTQNKAFRKKTVDKKDQPKFEALRSHLKSSLPKLKASDELRKNILSAIREKF